MMINAKKKKMTFRQQQQKVIRRPHWEQTQQETTHLRSWKWDIWHAAGKNLEKEEKNEIYHKITTR